MNKFWEVVQDPEFRRKVPTKIRHYREGETIIEEGTQGSEVYVILRGKAEVYATLNQPKDTGSRTGLAKLSATDVIGELALFDHKPRTASVIAVTDCEVAAIDGQVLASYMDRHPAQAYEMLKDLFSQLAQRMRQASLRSNTITALYLQGYLDI